MTHPALTEGKVAVITGAASGIGRATATALSGRGMRLVLVDCDVAGLEATAATLDGPARCVVVDVANGDAVDLLASTSFEAFGRVDVLMNNAAIRVAGSDDDGMANWRRTMDVNFWAAVHAERAFLSPMIKQGEPAIILNTGSKQGITNPPGNVIYNVTKSALKTYTEQLQHQLRNIAGCQVTAHLLVPGFTITGPHKPDPGGWTPEELVAFMLPRLERGDFYILCPDNEVTLDLDARRMDWAAHDIIDNRPPLSRWHPDWADVFTSQL